MRRSTGDSRLNNPLRWLIAALGPVGCIGAAIGLHARGINLGLPLPWWVVQGIVPIVLALLVVLSVPGASWERRCGATAFLWAVHLAVAIAIQGVIGEGPILPPPVLPALIGVPLLLIPLRDIVAAPRPFGEKRARFSSKEMRPPIARGRTTAPRAGVVGQVAVPAVRDSAKYANAHEPSRAPSPFSRERKNESTGDAVRIPFERIAGQLPARLAVTGRRRAGCGRYARRISC